MFVSAMFLTKTVLVLLLNAQLCLRARGESGNAGIPTSDCLETVDVALVVDVSGSIEGDETRVGYFNQHVKPFIKSFAKALHVAPGKAHVGMVTFGNFGTLEFNLTSDINEVLRLIDLFNYYSRGKNTNTSGGINVMRTQLLSPSAPNYRPDAAHIAVVITDGVSTIDKEQTIPSAKAAQRQGILILVVGVTEAINLVELTAMASPLGNLNISSLQSGIMNGVFTPSSTVAYVPEIEDLVNVVTKLVGHLKSTVCNSINKCPLGDKADWCSRVQPIECSNTSVAETCCKTCDTGPPKAIVCADYADIVFVLDVSGSIGKDRNDPDYFDRQIKPFLRSFVRRLNVAPEKVQIGMVTFGNYGKLEFTLKSDVNEIMRGIDKIVYPAHGEHTNTSGGINLMRTQVLSLYSPNFRPDAAHVAIVVTDGNSTWDHEKTLPSARAARNQGIIMFSIGATDSINLPELIGIASHLPGLNITALEMAIRNNFTGISGYVAYSPKIDDLKGIVDQLTSYLQKADCRQAVTEGCKDNAFWCSGIFPGQCYDPQTEEVCCNICRQSLTRDPKCRYGNQYRWCAPRYCWDLKTSPNCCVTCPRK